MISAPSPLPPPLTPHPGVLKLLDAAAAQGRQLGATVGGQGVIPDRKTLRSAVTGAVGGPPTGPAQEAELALLHEIETSRTKEGIARAKRMSVTGEGRYWNEKFEVLNAAKPLDDAAQGTRMLHEAMESAGAISGSLKDLHDRERPFRADPTLTPAVRRPPGATSYPSSHSARSYAAATVMGELWPNERKALLDAAHEVAFSRVYGGVHFPSDVAAGALVGAAAGAAALRAA